jgi:hypothetical protein
MGSLEIKSKLKKVKDLVNKVNCQKPKFILSIYYESFFNIKKGLVINKLVSLKNKTMELILNKIMTFLLNKAKQIGVDKNEVKREIMFETNKTIKNIKYLIVLKMEEEALRHFYLKNEKKIKEFLLRKVLYDLNEDQRKKISKHKENLNEVKTKRLIFKTILRLIKSALKKKKKEVLRDIFLKKKKKINELIVKEVESALNLSVPNKAEKKRALITLIIKKIYKSLKKKVFEQNEEELKKKVILKNVNVLMELLFKDDLIQLKKESNYLQFDIDIELMLRLLKKINLIKKNKEKTFIRYLILKQLKKKKYILKQKVENFLKKKGYIDGVYLKLIMDFLIKKQAKKAFEELKKKKKEDICLLREFIYTNLNKKIELIIKKEEKTKKEEEDKINLAFEEETKNVLESSQRTFARLKIFLEELKKKKKYISLKNKKSVLLKPKVPLKEFLLNRNVFFFKRRKKEVKEKFSQNEVDINSVKNEIPFKLTKEVLFNDWRLCFKYTGSNIFGTLTNMNGDVFFSLSSGILSSLRTRKEKTTVFVSKTLGEFFSFILYQFKIKTLFFIPLINHRKVKALLRFFLNGLHLLNFRPISTVLPLRKVTRNGVRLKKVARK